MLNRFLIILWISALLACNLASESEDHSASHHCENESFLISKANIEKSLDISIYDLKLSCIAHLRKAFDSSTYCCNDIRFSVLWNPSKAVEQEIALISDFNCTSCPITMKLREYYQVLINAENYILAESKMRAADELIDDLNKYYKYVNKEGNLSIARIKLQWDTETSIDTLNKTISNLIEGYLKGANEYSQAKFSSSICSLNEEDLIKLAADFPIKLDVCEQSPPDPPHDIKIDSLPNIG